MAGFINRWPTIVWLDGRYVLIDQSTPQSLVGTFGFPNIKLGGNSGLPLKSGSNLTEFWVGTDAGLNVVAAASNSIFMGTSAGNSATIAANSFFAGYEAGYAANNSSNSVMIGYRAGKNYAGVADFKAYDTVYIGKEAGYGAGNDVQYSAFIGVQAGYLATNAYRTSYFGYQAGYQATYGNDAAYIGFQAGFQANLAYQSAFLGNAAGYQATNARQSNFIGYQAGRAATDAIQSNFIGYQAGMGATNAAGSTFIGTSSGFNATAAGGSNFIGASAGHSATSAYGSIFIGASAGYQATNAFSATFIGASAGYGATNSYNGLYIGIGAGGGATDADGSVFFGEQAGAGATDARVSTFIGSYAGHGALDASDAIFIGSSAGDGAIGASSAIGLGGYSLFATYAQGAVAIGASAGSNSKYCAYSFLLGQATGSNTWWGQEMLAVGNIAGADGHNQYLSTFIGNGAGYGASNCANTFMIGTSAGDLDTLDTAVFKGIKIEGYNNETFTITGDGVSTIPELIEAFGGGMYVPYTDYFSYTSSDAGLIPVYGQPIAIVNGLYESGYMGAAGSASYGDLKILDSKFAEEVTITIQANWRMSAYNVTHPSLWNGWEGIVFGFQTLGINDAYELQYYSTPAGCTGYAPAAGSPVIQLTGGANNTAYGTYTGTPAGCATEVTIDSTLEWGADGNITLVGDGVKTLSELCTDYSNTYGEGLYAGPQHLYVSVTSGDGDQVPNNGTNIVLAGGLSDGDYASWTGTFWRSISGGSAFLMGNYTSTGGKKDVFVIGNGCEAKAEGELSIANVIYITDGWNNASTRSAEPQRSATTTIYGSVKLSELDAVFYDDELVSYEDDLVFTGG